MSRGAAPVVSECCGRPRFFFVTFEDARGGEWSVCLDCVGPDLERKPAPTLPPRAK